MISSELAREGDELFLDFVPNFRVGIDNFEVIGVLHCDELHVLTRFLFLFRVLLAEFVGDVFIGSTVNEDLLCRDVLFRGRRFAVMVRHLGWRAAKKTCDSVVAQMQLPAAMQIKHAGQREYASDGRFMGGKAECKLASGRVPGNAEALAIESRKFMLPVENEAKSGANIFKCPWPAATGIADAAVLNIAGGYADLFQRVAEMSGVSQIVFCAPVTAVDKKHHRMRRFALRDADINKLVGITAIGKAQIGIRRLGGQNVFARHKHAV